MTKVSLARLRSTVVAMGIAMIALTVPTAAQSPSLAMLDKLQPGQWEIRYRDDQPSTRLCVKNGRDLIQLRHKQAGCNRFVVEDAASEVTVQYTCKGNGYGRTSIRRESSTLVQLESQGIEGGLPFSFTAEGRRVGACP
ncbi:DUF3617 domain-containing protein [Parerythrobacter aestuarii]|uniref:DUF3617 domain-containing protein n=1 Tax=Parerythrobacter aestuarii TaxID=3020909 RepID=UPI0024DEC83B|nr:DUF3617 family protein [Parerythrobacter aestuarii]